MKKLSLSLMRCSIYFVVNILHICFFALITLAILNVGYDNYIILILLIAVLSVLAIYPLVFLVCFYLYDRNTEILFHETSEEIIYKRKGSNDLIFNVNDIEKMNVCFPFIRITVNHYYKIYLKSGQVVIVSCLIPIKEIKKRVNDQNEKVETVLWINELK